MKRIFSLRGIDVSFPPCICAPQGYRCAGQGQMVRYDHGKKEEEEEAQRKCVRDETRKEEGGRKKHRKSSEKKKKGRHRT